MIFTREKMIGAGAVMAAVFCLLAPQKINAEVVAVQQDGVMGQSLVDETLYNTEENAGYIQPTLLGATGSYTNAFLENSFTTDGDFTNATYYHKGDYEDYNLFNGIDVSWWQSVSKSKDDPNYRKISALDWSKIHDAGIDFAFVRVASRDNAAGTLYEDTCANSHIKGALANDINVGVYVFSQALTEKEAVEEANYVLKLVKKYGWKITMPIVIDREAGSYKRLTGGKLSKTKETAVCQAFADTITDAGYNASVYASQAWIKSYINTNTLNNCGIWIARYNITTTSNSKSGTPYSDVAYDYEFWQYSSIGKVNGYSGNLDVSFWYKDTSIKTKGLKMSDNTEDSITLNWSAAGDATGYRIYRYDASTDKYAYVGSTTKKSYTDTDLAEGTGYQYKVRAYWKIGGTNYYGSYSSILSATTSLGKVSDVEVDKSTDTTMTLSWNAVKNATGYRIYQYDEDEESYVQLADVEASEESYKVTDLSGATEYRFKVRAYKTVDTTKYWGSYSEECVDITCPAKVKELNVETDSSTAITLSWNKVARATGYRIYRLNTESGKYQLIKTVKSASTRVYTDEKLASGEAYSYKVRAYKSYDGTNYYGSYSDVRSAATKPAKVKNLKLTTKSSKVTLKWDKVKNATGYQIYRLNTKTGKYEKIATVKGATTCTYKTAKLTKGKTYTYKVRAYKNYDGENYYGSYSTISEVKVK